MEANKILQADILDLVFEDRNKDYGAYQLRKTYNKRIMTALIITGSVALLALLGSILASELNSTAKDDIEIKEVTIQDIKQEEEIKELQEANKPKTENAAYWAAAVESTKEIFNQALWGVLDGLGSVAKGAEQVLGTAGYTLADAVDPNREVDSETLRQNWNASRKRLRLKKSVSPPGSPRPLVMT